MVNCAQVRLPLVGVWIAALAGTLMVAPMTVITPTIGWPLGATSPEVAAWKPWIGPSMDTSASRAVWAIAGVAAARRATAAATRGLSES